MKKNILIFTMLTYLFFFSGCTCFFPVLDYVDENNKSYITLLNEDSCTVKLKYLGTYPSYPDTHGLPVDRNTEILSHDQTCILIINQNKSEILIQDCRLELRDENKKIIPYIKIKAHTGDDSSYSTVKSLSKIEINWGYHDLIYLYDSTYGKNEVHFYLKLTLLIKDKIHIIEKTALLKRKDGTVFWSPFFTKKY